VEPISELEKKGIKKVANTNPQLNSDNQLQEEGGLPRKEVSAFFFYRDSYKQSSPERG